MYESLNFVKSPLTRSTLSTLRFRDRAEFAERWHCHINMHRAYLSKSAVLPILSGSRVLRWTHAMPPHEFGSNGKAALNVHGSKMRLRFNDDTVALFTALDGRTSNSQIIDKLNLNKELIQLEEQNVRNLMTLELVKGEI
ncbi:hypothetical protein [Thalassobaculum sp.]|uniref:hypothetical protein n=1 Tax=Thalassobaculum sp. TaxID=2022740 RepID=UPI0032EDF170